MPTGKDNLQIAIEEGHWKLAAIESIKFYLHQQLNANAETDMQIPIVG